MISNPEIHRDGPLRDGKEIAETAYHGRVHQLQACWNTLRDIFRKDEAKVIDAHRHEDIGVSRTAPYVRRLADDARPHHLIG